MGAVAAVVVVALALLALGALGVSGAGATISHGTKRPIPDGTLLACVARASPPPGRSPLHDPGTWPTRTTARWVPGRTGNFIVSVLRTPRKDAIAVLNLKPITALGPDGHGVRHFSRGGAGFYLQVNSQCAWSVEAYRTGQ